MSNSRDITGLVDFVDYDKDIDIFVDKLNIVNVRNRERAVIAEEAIKTIKLKGYSIWDNGKRIEELYEVYINDAKK